MLNPRPNPPVHTKQKEAHNPMFAALIAVMVPLPPIIILGPTDMTPNPETHVERSPYPTLEKKHGGNVIVHKL